MITNSITSPELPGISLVAGDVAFPVSDMKIIGNVDGDGLVWQVVATFENPLDAPVEATFTIPLPNGGAVVGMKMKIGERNIEADIKEREAARVEYEEAKDQGFTAALFEQDRAEIFNISVGNIHPNETISVVIEVHDRVAIDGTEASLRMPTMIKQRFIPEGIPDAAAINPPRTATTTPLQGTVTINFADEATDVACETVPSAVITSRMVTITDFDLTCDVILRWTIPAAIAQAKWVADSDDPEVGTLEVNIRVPEKKDTPRRRKAVQIMFDRSGSMSHHYLEWARRISMDVIASLSDDDLVHALTFDSVIEVLGPTEHGFVRATRPVKKALQEQMLKITARGGTNLTEALQAGGAALAMVNDLENSEEIDRIALLITDGAYGDEASAIYHRENDLGGSRVIAVAIGENANGFLEILSANGVCVYVSSEVGLSEASNKVMSRVSTAAYSQAQLVADGLTHQAPKHAPDIYPEVVVNLSGRMPRPKDGASVEVIALGEHVVTLPIKVSTDTSTTTRWANQHIKSLDYSVMSADFASTGIENHSALEAEIVDLSIKYKVLSKYTAWLAVDRSRSTDQVIVKKVIQPVYDSMTTDSSMDLVLRSVSYTTANYAPRFSIENQPMSMAELLDHIDGVTDYHMISDLLTLAEALKDFLAAIEEEDELEDIWEEIEIAIASWRSMDSVSIIGRNLSKKIDRRLTKLLDARDASSRVHKKFAIDILSVIKEIKDHLPAQ